MLISNISSIRHFVTLAFSLVVLGFSTSSLAIKKCQDADGNWHYGDSAVQECENSKITTLNDRGFVTDEEEAPKSAAEVRAEEERLAAEQKKEAEEQAALEEKRRILEVYETEQDIDRQRDNQLRSVQSNINVHEAYLKNMRSRVSQFETKISETTNQTLKQELLEDVERSKKSIQEYESELVILKEQKKAVLDRYKQEKATYRELKQESLEKNGY